MASYILSHDIGTSGDKATLFCEGGRLVASDFASYTTRYPRAGWAEQDAGDYWDAFCRSTRSLLAKASCTAGEVAVVSFSGQMMAALPIGSDGTPLRRSIIWADQRSTAEADEIARSLPAEAVYRITGHRLSPSYSAAKIMWIRRNEPELYRRAAKFVHAKDFLALKLTGRFVTDLSDASGMNLLDIDRLEWSPEMLAATGISAELLPEPCESTEIVGKILPEAARRCGLLEGTPVVIGGGDGACANCGAGVVREGEVYLSLGTSAWVAGASTRPLFDPGMRIVTFALFRRGLYMPIGTMQLGGGALHWLTEAIGGEGGLEAINREAAAAPPGSDGLLFLPYLMGERSPRWNPHARGCYVGLSMVHHRGHLARAVMEGVALNARVVVDTLARLGLNPSVIRAIGGGAKSELWMSIFAEVLERPMATLNFVDEATSVGAAIAGGVGVGLFASIEEAARMVRIERRVEPDSGHIPAYRRAFPIFERAYEQLVPVFEMLASE